MTTDSRDPSSGFPRRLFRFFDLTHAAVLVFVFGTLITLLAFLAIRKNETDKLTSEFDRMAIGTSHIISESIASHTDHLQALQGF